MRRRSMAVMHWLVLSLSLLDYARDDPDPSTSAGPPRARSKGEHVEGSKDEPCRSWFDKLTTSVCIGVLMMAAAIGPACSRPSRLAADLVITGADIWTGNPQQPDARAVAIVGDR